MNRIARLLFAQLVAVMVLNGCAQLPPIKLLDPSQETAVREACLRPFLTEKVRLIHAVKAVLPGGHEGTAIGFLVADPRNESFKSVLMTIEGVVLFDMDYGKSLTVNRAVPPFDAPAFAGRMSEDIRLAFFHPGREPAAIGREKGGAAVCRFERDGGEFVDVVQHENGEMALRLYGAGQELRKNVRIPRLERPGLAEALEIRDAGWPSYSLHLRLLESEPVAD